MKNPIERNTAVRVNSGDYPCLGVIADSEWDFDQWIYKVITENGTSDWYCQSEIFVFKNATE